MKTTWIASITISLAAMVACGDSTGSGGAGAGGSSNGGSGTGGTQQPPPESCTQPGDAGNEIGVGEFCTPLGHQCDDNTIAQLCLADVGQTEWMCTRIMCDETTDCGEGAGCLLEDGGSACVPCACDSRGIGCDGAGGGGVGGAGGGSAGGGGSGGGA